MINWQMVRTYIRHRLKAKTRHGVHSPFVYRLVDEIIYDFAPNEKFSPIENLREKLLKDERFISITDLGAGSHLNNNKQKQVRQLAGTALKPPKLAALIGRLAEDAKPATIIELGTCLGVTTAYLAKAVPEARVITVEGCPETAAVAAGNFRELNLENVDLQVGNFDEVLPGLLQQLESLDFIYVDGNHRKDATLKYFELCLPKAGPDSVFVFDDIYWSKGMEEAWDIIRKHPRVTVSIDLFWIGIVYFKKGQAREDFKIRF